MLECERICMTRDDFAKYIGTYQVERVSVIVSSMDFILGKSKTEHKEFMRIALDQGEVYPL